MKGRFWRKALAAALALLIVSGGVPVKPFTEIFSPAAITAEAASDCYLTDFLPVSSSGTATGYFTYSDHFYKVDWSGINTSQTTSVQLFSNSYGKLKAQRNGLNADINLYSSESQTYWLLSNITNLTPGQSSYGYTSFDNLATGADGTSLPKVYKKVCTITCMAANEPTWNWSEDYSTCTATFTCAENATLTATVNANITEANGSKTATATFNGTEYSDTKKTSCIVTWKNYDGTMLKTDTIEYGKTPSYSGATPAKAGDAQYSYTFSGWSPAVSAVTSDTTYTAQFSSTTNKYTVTWKNGNTTLKTDTVEYGKTPSYSGATPTKASDEKYNYTFKAWSPAITTVSGDVTYTAEFTKTPVATHFSQNGDIFTIKDETGWVIFCYCLQDNDTYNRFIGKTVNLDANIGTAENPITTMAGSSNHDFCGTFNGKGHTITFSYDGTDSETGIAPFHYVSETCKIENLNVIGTINTMNKYAGGIVGMGYGNLTLTNCRSSVTINSSMGSEDEKADGTHGGLIGVINHSGCRYKIDGCIFDGELNGRNTKCCGGFVGYNKGELTIENSIFAPAAINTDVTNSASFARDGKTLSCTNCYYTQNFNDAANYIDQGKQAYTITPGDDVTIDYGESTKSYDYNGIEVYSEGLVYGSSFYTESGKTIPFTLDHIATPDGCIFNGYSATAGVLTAADNAYTLTMPAENVTINAQFAEVFTGESISLGGDIGVIFYLNPDAVKAGDIVAFTKSTNGESIVCPAHTIEESDKTSVTVGEKQHTYYAVTCSVNAAEMTSRITASITVNGEEYSAATSVREYADTIMSSGFKTAYYSGKDEEYSRLYDLVVKMLDYGAKAQTKFGKNTDNLANKDLKNANRTDYVTDSAITSESISSEHTDMENGLSGYGISYEGTSLLYLNKTTLRHYYTITDTNKTADGIIAEIIAENSGWTGGKKGSFIYFEKPDIGADELAAAYILRIGSNEYAFSALDYSKGILEIVEADKGLTADDADLARATYLYATAAAAYMQNGGV